jgi:hypothetical protein
VASGSRAKVGLAARKLKRRGLRSRLNVKGEGHRRRVDANREQAETLRQAIRAYSENETPETRRPP